MFHMENSFGWFPKLTKGSWGNRVHKHKKEGPQDALEKDVAMKILS